MAQVQHLDTIDSFTLLYNECKKTNRRLFVKAGTLRCGPCQAIAPHFAKLVAERDIWAAEFDTQELPQLCEAFQIKSLPTFLLLSPNPSDPIATLSSSCPEALKVWMRGH
jgi:thiol-disulfide isomerase/thioredoxin